MTDITTKPALIKALTEDMTQRVYWTAGARPAASGSYSVIGADRVARSVSVRVARAMIESKDLRLVRSGTMFAVYRPRLGLFGVNAQ